MPVADDEFHVLNGYSDSTMVDLSKSWPMQAQGFSRAAIRIVGTRCERKRVGFASGDPLLTWFFGRDPRWF